MKVLYVASNPDPRAALNLEHEVTELQRAFLAASGDLAELIFLPSLPFEDLAGHISRHKPDIVHISAHGSNGVLALATGDGRQFVELTGDMLCSFLDVEPAPKIVYLNACNSATVAKQVLRRVPAAIGISTPITNLAATKAAVAFYSRLLEGRSIKQAFQGCEMVMRGIDNSPGMARCFFRSYMRPEDTFLHTPTRIVARFWKDNVRFAADRHCSFELGLVGARRNTTQVVFFTDDESFITRRDRLEESLCTVTLARPVKGEIWTEERWRAVGDFKLFACGVTADGGHYSVSSTLCSALQFHYLAKKRSGDVEALPAAIRKSIEELRLRDGASISQ